jgi:hypothetical protein
VRISTPVCVALTVLCMLACRPVSSPAGVVLALADVDRQWDDRGAEAHADTLRILDGLDERERATTPVMWRRARSITAGAMTMLKDSEARDAYAQARQVALDCLDADPYFRERRLAVGLVKALPSVGEERRQCVDQLAWAWTRWFVLVGHARAAIDLAEVEALTLANRDPTTGPWSQGLLASANTDYTSARAQLERLVATHPSELHIRADLAVYVLSPQRDEEAVRHSLAVVEAQASAERATDMAAVQRLRQVVGDLP